MDLLAQTYDYTTSSSSSGSPIVAIIYIAVVVAAIAGMWKMFVKAGQPGWGSIVPFYNSYLMVKMANRETWWFILFFIPIANVIASIVIMNDISKAFGKSTGFTILMIFLPFIAMPILGFGDAKYTKPAAK